MEIIEMKFLSHCSLDSPHFVTINTSHEKANLSHVILTHTKHLCEIKIFVNLLFKTFLNFSFHRKRNI